ncbi:MAG: Universal stress protein family [Acidobacteria bacterium]|nr:Universal stress protein family [Acidobacteriota bacterium]
MFQIKGPILAAMDLDKGSEELLRQADALARSYKVKLFVCHVLPEIFAVRPLFPQLHLDDALKSYDLEASVRDALLKRVRMVTAREPPKIEIEIEQGTVHAGILRAADNIGAGAVVVGGKVDHGGLRVLGSAAEHVVRYAKCPVLVARPSPAGKILAVTDFSDPALPALEAGAAEARHRKADLVILHAVDLFPVVSSFYGEFYSDGMPPMDYSDQMRKTWKQRLDGCVHRFRAKGGGLLPDGPAAPAILSAALELPANLLVMGTHGRTGLSRIMALGSVAEAVVRAAPCSVLVVRLV